MKLYILTECLLIPLTFNHNILCVLNDQRVTFAYQSPGKPCVNREVELGSRSWMDCLASELLFSQQLVLWTLSLRFCSPQLSKGQIAEYTTTLASVVLVVAACPVFAGRSSSVPDRPWVVCVERMQPVIFILLILFSNWNSVRLSRKIADLR